jgi:uncharacterized alkaline shock family protein YloU
MRRRTRAHGSPLRVIGRLLVLALALALVWYGLMTALVALKLISPATADQLSGYRTAFDYLAGLTPGSFSTTARLIIAAIGILAFLVFGWLALKELPRRRSARAELQLKEDDRGSASIQPRAIERIAETAATENSAVTGANGRFGTEQLAVTVSVRRARDIPDTLRDVQGRVRDALAQHGLPVVPVDVTLTGFDRKQRREVR